MTARDDFSPKTKNALAGRAGYVCSNPHCKRPTAGAALGDNDKAVNMGVAAHIKAAAPGGPRYDPEQTASERSHVSNGIWLCNVHAKQIDNDPGHFTVEMLNGWKQRAEAQSAQALLTLQKPGVTADQLAPGVAAQELAQRLGLPAEDDVLTVASRLQLAARQDLDAFVRALKSPVNAIPLSLRLIDDQKATPFQVAGLAAAIRTFNEIVVVAAPGTGKTTTLLQVAHSVTDTEQQVATYIPLSEWSAQTHSLLQSVVQRAAFAGEREAHLKLLADAGRLVLVLDGWNELDMASRKRLRIEIQSLKRDYPDLGFIMSTRLGDAGVPVSGPVVEIEPLSEAQQLSIAQASRSDAGEGILDQAWRTHGLRDLVAIPLYLTTLLSSAPGARLPTTKEEVLRLFVAGIDQNANQREALEAVAFGFHKEILSKIAAEATLLNRVSISNHQARRFITDVSKQLISEGQISSALQPESVLTALARYHLLIRTENGVEFQHQQFQEWFASLEVERHMLAAAAATGDSAARHHLHTAILNAYAWEEAVLFACERTSRGGAEAVSATANLVLDALEIDPLLSAEAIYRGSEALWNIVKGRVLAFATVWHSSAGIDRAVRFMIKTGRSEFAETIWPFIADANGHQYLDVLRAGGRFRLSVLGGDAAERIAQLALPHRSDVLSELVIYGGIEEIEAATNIALSDGDTEVKIAVAEALFFRLASRQMQRLLADAPVEVWQSLARNGFARESLVPEITDRLQQESIRLIDEEQRPAWKLNLILRCANNQQRIAEQVQTLIGTANFSGENTLADEAIHLASRFFPAEVKIALVERLERQLPMPSGAESLLKNASVVLDTGPIASLALSASSEPKLACIAAGLLGPNATGQLIDALFATLKHLNASPSQEARNEYHRVLGLISLTPVESFAAAVLGRAPTSDPGEIEELAILIASHGERGSRERIVLGGTAREAIIALIAGWVDLLLAKEDTCRRTLVEVVQAIERLAEPELAAPLTRMLARELMQWRQQREAQAEARARGRHDPASEAHHSWSLQYKRAFVAIGDDQVIATLQSYLLDAGLTGFGLEAARALRAIWRRRQGIGNDRLFGGSSEFAEVRQRRAKQQGSAVPATSPFAEAIFAAVEQLLQRGQDNEAQIYALQLAAIGLGMPYGNKRATVDQLLRLDQPYDTKLELLTALVSAGEVIESGFVADCVNALLEDAKDRPWLMQENQGTIDRWLSLLPFTDRPEATLEVLARMDAQLRQPWRLRPLLISLGFAPSDRAEQVLLELAKQDPRLLEEHYWFAALEKCGTLSLLCLLLDLLCHETSTGWPGKPDPRTFGQRLASGMRKYPEFRADVNSQFAQHLSLEARAIVEYAVAEAPDESGVRLLVESHASDGRALSGILRSAIKRLIVEQRPVPDWSGAYDQISVPAPSLRKWLFDFARSTCQGAELALACLVYIDELRDTYGTASGEPRHPNIDSEVSWPLLRSGEGPGALLQQGR